MLSVLGVGCFLCGCFAIFSLFLRDTGSSVSPSNSSPSQTPILPTPTSTASPTLYDELMANKDNMTDLQFEEYVNSLIGARIHLEGKVRDVHDDGEILLDAPNSDFFDSIYLQGVPEDIAITYDKDEIIIFDATIRKFNYSFGTSLYLDTPVIYETPPVSLLPAPTDTSAPIIIPTSTAKTTDTIVVIVNAPQLLGKTVSEVENILGAATLITPNDDNDDNLAGGEYRDYQVDRYTVMVAYDKTGVSRVFQVMDGISDENYALQDWNIILPKFGIQIGISPDREAPLAVYWDNYNGYFIAVAGDPVYTVQIAEYEYHP